VHFLCLTQALTNTIQILMATDLTCWSPLDLGEDLISCLGLYGLLIYIEKQNAFRMCRVLRTVSSPLSSNQKTLRPRPQLPAIPARYEYKHLKYDTRYLQATVLDCEVFLLGFHARHEHLAYLLLSIYSTLCFGS